MHIFFPHKTGYAIKQIALYIACIMWQMIKSEAAFDICEVIYTHKCDIISFLKYI